TRLLRIVGMPDRPPKPHVQLAALENHLLSVDRSGGFERNEKVPRILHIDYEHRLVVRRYLTDRAELLTAIRNERLVSDLDVLAHALLPLRFVAESAGNLRFRGFHHALSAWSIASGSAENLAAGRTLPSSEPPFNPASREPPSLRPQRPERNTHRWRDHADRLRGL